MPLQTKAEVLSSLMSGILSVYLKKIMPARGPRKDLGLSHVITDGHICHLEMQRIMNPVLLEAGIVRKLNGLAQLRQLLVVLMQSCRIALRLRVGHGSGPRACGWWWSRCRSARRATDARRWRPTRRCGRCLSGTRVGETHTITPCNMWAY